jgi:hypothetical protein
MKRARSAIAIAAVMILAGIIVTGLMAGLAAVSDLRTPARGGIAPVWTEIRWPFLLDQWGVGRAFLCGPADCGVRTSVAIRAKIGFCNCATGVSDDVELERVADTDLFSPAVRPLGPGAPVDAGWMHGRSRLYQVSAAKPDDRLLSVAVNDRCDAVVAVAALGNANPAVITPAVVAFLNSPAVLQWARKELGL